MTASKFKVGDRVWSFYFGVGTVTEVTDDSTDLYPIRVTWGKNAKFPKAYDYFTADGKICVDYEGTEKTITLSDAEDIAEDVKSESDAINPSHYRVEGIPEAIEIMQGLMTKEQYEGFLWGNIIKYAYRFGRKGDKAETAGKIAWYANKLKEREESKE